MDQRWRKGDGTHTDRFGYGYDRNSNRMYRENLITAGAAYSELYHARGSSGTYDDLDQLSEFVRGTLNTAKDDVTESTPARRQKWTTLDILGNWTTFDEWVGSSQTTQNRTHNKQNQLTAIGSTNLSFDANGNLTTDESARTLTYDAWNRVMTVTPSSGPYVAYSYDALNRRQYEYVSSPALTRSLYYSAAWQVLEEYYDSDLKAQYVWSPVYVDAMILRDRDANGVRTDGLEERLYVQQDANWNVTAVINTSGAVQERYVYDPYGVPTRLTASWGTAGSDTLKWVYLHQGGRFDATVDLYHFRMRDFNPRLGRWVQMDPIGFKGGDINLYGYLHKATGRR